MRVNGHAAYPCYCCGLYLMPIVRRYVVQSPGRDDAVQHLEVRFDYEAPPMVEPKSSQPTPEKKRVAQPKTWKRFKWTCDVVCSECNSECTKLPLQDPPLCDKSCKLNCAEAAPVSLREAVRKLRQRELPWAHSLQLDQVNRVSQSVKSGKSVLAGSQ